MTMLLNGQKVEGKNLKVTASLSIESEDMSGQTSNTETAHKGFKPKSLAVSLMILYQDTQQLRALMTMAEATETGGQRATYRIVNDTAAAFGVRQVQFSDSVSAREADNLKAWMVQFTLTEKLSNPEKVEKRRPAAAVSQQATSGVAVGSTSGTAGESTGSSSELTGFEKVLKHVDDYLGGAA
ncbi:DNA-binding protein [Pseudomonas putida]|uniref:baseplate complex protein n=1 Tax=Pseudomonas putida TaxID=303 RepID=UPI002B24AE55|nr:DNA-binding protein [Pseudomonas putida]